MDFDDLMSIASSKQQVTEKKAKNKKSKDNTVSSDAVKAFLARKNAEKAKQKAEEEAARRARIQARLEQERKDKAKNKKNKDGSSTSNDLENQKSRSTLQSQSIAQPIHKQGEKARVAHQRKYEENRDKNLEIKQKLTEKRHKHMENKEKIAVNKHKDTEPKPKAVERKQKNPEAKQKEAPKQQTDDKNLVKRPVENELKKPVKKIRKPAVPALSFQELMSVAKQQADNPEATRELLAKRQPVKEAKSADLKEKAVIKDSDVIKNEKLVKNKKPLPAAKPSSTSLKASKEIPEKRKADGISKEMSDALTNARAAQKLLQQRNPEVRRTTSEKPKQMMIERETISEKRRELMTKRYVQEMQRKRRYHDDDDEEEEMDEFIDDSEAAPDISSYIKDIFGYDRTKFRDREDDVDNMESSFADIQREEAKSSRIAKLEDELEKLKEMHELQRPKKKNKLKR